MAKMAEENVYANVPKRTGQNKGLQPQHAPHRRSKVTVERVALVVLSVLLLAAVAALAGLSVRRSCEDESGAMEQTTTAPVKTCLKRTNLCDVNWTFDGTKCYYVSTKTSLVSWGGGSAACRDMDADLVKIDSREEQAFLFHRLLVDNDRFWIGLTDSQTEGDWTWTDGSSLNPNLTFWDKEPDNWKGHNDEFPEAEDCVLFKAEMGNSKDKCWADVYCGLRHRFVCEKEPACNSTV